MPAEPTRGQEAYDPYPYPPGFYPAHLEAELRRYLRNLDARVDALIEEHGTYQHPDVQQLMMHGDWVTGSPAMPDEDLEAFLEDPDYPEFLPRPPATPEQPTAS